MIDSTTPQGRRAEFALGATFKADPEGTLANGVHETGQTGVVEDVKHAVSNHSTFSEAYAQEHGYRSQSEMRGGW